MTKVILRSNNQTMIAGEIRLYLHAELTETTSIETLSVYTPTESAYEKLLNLKSSKKRHSPVSKSITS